MYMAAYKNRGSETRFLVQGLGLTFGFSVPKSWCTGLQILSSALNSSGCWVSGKATSWRGGRKKY